MALKSSQSEAPKVDIEEALDYVDKTLDRVKVLYEQYFLGMQKQPPTQVHTDVERRLRELQQLNIRNTGLRYRFATLQQKFGSYNSYWRRTVRQIENGTYIRNLAKISRNAALTGEEVPEEILAAMPKRMREQVKRDREQALAIKKRREHPEGDFDVDMGDFDDDAAVISNAPPKQTMPPPMRGQAHVLGGDDGDFDIEAFFASVTDEKPSQPFVRQEEDTRPKAPPVAPARPSHPARTMPIARVAAAAVPVPRVDDEETGVHGAPRPVEDEPTGVVTPAVRALPGLPIKQAAIPGVTNLVPPRGTATPPLGAAVRPKPGEVPHQDIPTRTQAVPVVPPPRPGTPPPIPRQTPPPLPKPPSIPAPPQRTQAMPVVPMPPKGAAGAPSQQSRPNPIAPGAASGRQPIPVQSMQGPFERTPVAPKPAPAPAPKPAPAAQRPPPGMNDADVNALYAKYVKAKQMVGEEAGPGAYSKLMKTINTQAPKIMEQYKAKGVEFSVVVKDNQVIIKAKPKT